MAYDHLDDDYEGDDEEIKPTKMDAISQLMGTATPVNMGRELTTTEPESTDPDERKKADFETARKNIKDIINQGMEIVPDMMNNVRLSESPKMYDSAANYLRMLSELNEKLVNINGKDGKSSNASSSESPVIATQTNNNMFIGTLQEAMSLMKKIEKPD